MAAKAATDRHREANVELDLRLHQPASHDAIDACSDAVLDALENYAGDVALGSAALVDFAAATVSVEFYVLGDSPTEIYQKVAAVMAILERETDLPLDSIRTTIEFAYAQGDVVASGEGGIRTHEAG